MEVSMPAKPFWFASLQMCPQTLVEVWGSNPWPSMWFSHAGSYSTCQLNFVKMYKTRLFLLWESHEEFPVFQVDYLKVYGHRKGRFTIQVVKKLGSPEIQQYLWSLMKNRETVKSFSLRVCSVQCVQCVSVQYGFICVFFFAKTMNFMRRSCFIHFGTSFDPIFYPQSTSKMSSRRKRGQRGSAKSPKAKDYTIVPANIPGL